LRMLMCDWCGTGDGCSPHGRFLPVGMVTACVRAYPGPTGAGKSASPVLLTSFCHSAIVDPRYVLLLLVGFASQ